jgi:ABC-type multidrug transport system permease subunit
LVHLTSTSMYRFIASIFQTVVASTLAGSLIVLIVLLFGGFLIQKRKISLSYSNNLVSRIYSDDNT